MIFHGIIVDAAYLHSVVLIKLVQYEENKLHIMAISTLLQKIWFKICNNYVVKYALPLFLAALMEIRKEPNVNHWILN